jgi:putative thioredoxin
MSYEMQDFGKDVIEASRTRPVVIDFWAPWCGPCRQLGPAIEKLAGEAAGRWSLVKINTDQHPDIAGQFQIRGIPAVKMVYDGKLIGEFTGAKPEAAIRQWLETHLPAEFAGTQNDWKEAVASALEEGDREEALAVLRQITDPDDEALLAMAMLHLPEAPEDARALIQATKASDAHTVENDVVQTVRHLAAVADGTAEPKPGALPDQDAMRRNYAEGARALMEHDFERSLLHFLEVLQRDRAYDEDGARKACVAIFRMLGEAHPLSRKYRRAFSMSLY